MADEQWDVLSFECGAFTIVAREGSLCRIFFESTPDAASAMTKKHYPQAEQSTLQPLIREGFQQLREYFLGKRRSFDLPLDSESTSEFACRVQQAMIRVPYGSVVTYGELADKAGSPGAARAVGSFLSSNPFPLVVPCHRVVNADGTLGSYSAGQGSSTKVWLIDFERELAGR
jgi:methylated-DNA-[protein]-cysteine S-methyltransferase